MPKEIRGMPINKVHSLNPCPVKAGIPQPINIGISVPTTKPNSLSFFLVISLSKINLIQTLASKFHLSLPWVAHF